MIAIVIAIFAVILFIVVKVVAIIAVHSTDDGILSVAGSLLPTIFLTSVGYLGKRSLKIIRSSDTKSLNLKKTYQLGQDYELFEKKLMNIKLQPTTETRQRIHIKNRETTV